MMGTHLPISYGGFTVEARIEDKEFGVITTTLFSCNVVLGYRRFVILVILSIFCFV